MKKPINKFTVMSWVLAVVVRVAYVMTYVSIIKTLEGFGESRTTFYDLGGGIWSILQGGVMSAVQLTSFGVIIELIDQIRWNGLQRSKE